MRSDCPELGTAIHADSPFNRLKAALNYDRHVVDKRDNAPVALTRRGLSSLVQDPAEMILFIQKEFMLKDGSRISFKAAVALAFGVCTLFRTCAVALAVSRCTPRPRVINVAVHSWPSHIVFGFPPESRGMVVLLASRWLSPCSPVRMNAAVPWCDALGGHVGTSTDAIPQFCAWNRCRYARGGRPPSRGGATAVAIAQSVHHCKCARG